ncbi:MAG: PEP-CTERM/exosortase system-associated acyltransferase [Pseudomonadales bacterium]
MSKYDSLLEDFQLVFVNNDSLMSHVHKIRYEIFCKELELEESNPKNVEQDEFDAYSFHYLLQHKRSNQYAGTMRMVLPPCHLPELLTPLEKYCLNAVDLNIIDISKLARGSFAEVSRLAVPKLFRKRAEDRGKPDITKAGVTTPNRRQCPHIAIGLYLTAAALFLLNQLDYVFIMIEPKFVHSLARVGLQFEQMGEVVDYHGQRAPFFITPERLKKHLNPELKPLYSQIMKQVRDDLRLHHPISKVG